MIYIYVFQSIEIALSFLQTTWERNSVQMQNENQIIQILHVVAIHHLITAFNN